MSVNWTKGFEDCLPTKQEVDALESQWGMVLPTLYKSHLLNYAGCFPDRKTLHFQKDSNSRIRYFGFVQLCHLKNDSNYPYFTSSVQFRSEMYNDSIDRFEDLDIEDIPIWPICTNGSNGGFFFDYREGSSNPRIGFYGNDLHFLDPDDTTIFPAGFTYEHLLELLVVD